MQSFIITLLACSATMSIFILLYTLITPILSKYYSAKIRYYVWLIIIIGLIIPFRPQFNNTVVRIEVPNEIISPIVHINDEMLIDTVPYISTTSSYDIPIISLWEVTAIIWFLGAIVFLSYHIIKYYFFTKIIRRWSCVVLDEEVLYIFRQIKTELRISKNINLYMCPTIGSPMLIGFINPQIILPKINLTHDELYFILKHELVHYKRKDPYYSILELFACTMHWFNPIIHLMTREIDALCEISCDEEVVQNTDSDIRLHYSETIIRVMKHKSILQTTLSTNFYGGKKCIKKRLLCIMDKSKKKTGVALIFLALISTTSTGIAFATNINANNQDNINTSIQAIVSRLPNNDVSTPIQSIVNKLTSSQDDLKNQYSLYEQYGLMYNIKEDRLYYNDQIVRYFVDRLNNGHGVMSMWAYDFDGTIDLHTIRNNVGSEGELIGISVYSQEDFDLRTKEIEANQNNIPDYDIMTFRFRKDEAPESLKLWIRQIENDIFDFATTQQNGRYYIYVRATAETDFAFSISSANDGNAHMEILNIAYSKGDGYALFSVPLYSSFTVTYNGYTSSFLQ